MQGLLLGYEKGWGRAVCTNVVACGPRSEWLQLLAPMLPAEMTSLGPCWVAGSVDRLVRAPTGVCQSRTIREGPQPFLVEPEPGLALGGVSLSPHRFWLTARSEWTGPQDLSAKVVVVVLWYVLHVPSLAGLPASIPQQRTVVVRVCVNKSRSRQFVLSVLTVVQCSSALASRCRVRS